MNVYNILLVDDSKTIQKVVELTVKDIEGIDIHLASDSEQAFDILNRQKIDLMFVDVNLPDNNGYYIVENIRKKDLYTKTPIYLIWGTFEQFDTDIAIKCGSSGFFRKPFESEFFLNIINYAKNGNPILDHKEINNQTIEFWSNIDKIQNQDDDLFQDPESEIENQDPAEDEDFLFEEEEIKTEEIEFAQEAEYLFEDPDMDNEPDQESAMEEDEIAEITDVHKSDEPFFKDADYAETEEVITKDKNQKNRDTGNDTLEMDIELKKDETMELDDEDLENIKKGKFPVAGEKETDDHKSEDIEEEEETEEIETANELDSETADEKDNISSSIDVEDVLEEEEEEILELSPIETDKDHLNIIEQDVETKEEPSLESYMDNRSTTNDQNQVRQDFSGKHDKGHKTKDIDKFSQLEEAFEEAEESLEDTIEFTPSNKPYQRRENADINIVLNEIKDLKADLNNRINSLMNFFQNSFKNTVQESINSLLEKKTQEILWETLPPIINNFLSEQVNKSEVKDSLLLNINQELDKALLEKITNKIIEKIDIEVVEETASKILENICWEVVPSLSEIIIKNEVEKLKNEDEE